MFEKNDERQAQTGLKYNESRIGNVKVDDGQAIMLVVGALVFVPVLVMIGAFLVIVLVVMPSLDGPTLLLLVGIGLFLSVVVAAFVKLIRFYTDPFDHDHQDRSGQSVEG